MMRQAEVLVRSTLGNTVGTWPLFEARNKTLHWPGALRAQRLEQREAARLRASVVVPPSVVATIISTYRRPDSLVRAVRSALNQTVRDHVVIVVDDGGGLPPLPRDDRLVAVSLSRNIGRAGIVRNVGIRLSRSTYLAFLDDDNEWLPRHLEVSVEALDRGADLVYTAVDRVRPDGTLLDVLSQPFDRRSLAHQSYVDTSSIVVRRRPGARFSRLPRSRADVPGEDWELVWRLSRRWRVQHVPETTVTYLVNPDSYFTQWSIDEGTQQ